MKAYNKYMDKISVSSGSSAHIPSPASKYELKATFPMLLYTHTIKDFALYLPAEIPSDFEFEYALHRKQYLISYSRLKT